MKRPRRQPRNPSSRFYRIAALLILAFAIDIVVEAANPFGMVDVVKAKAVETLQLVAGPFSKSTRGQDAVTVVLIDQHYFDSLRSQSSSPVWPMAVNRLTMGVIRRVLDAEPRALFIDITFPDAPREIVDGGRNSREEALRALAAGLADLDRHIPIFLGDDLVPGPDLSAERARCGIDFLPEPSLAANRALAAPLVKQLFADRQAAAMEVVDASWPGSSTVYQLAPSLIGAGGNCRRLLDENRGFVPSPALALFAAYTQGCAPGRSPAICRTDEKVARLAQALHLDQRSPVDRHGLRTYRLDERAQGALALRWQVTVSAKMAGAVGTSKGADDCAEQFYRNPFDALKNYLIHMFGPVQRRFGEPTQRRCVYIDTISAGDLGDYRQFETSDPGGEPGADIAGKFLKDRMVLLGVDLPQSPDRFRSPINGEVPGVYMHATAVENLITYGDGYPRAEPGLWPWLMTTLSAIIVIAAMAWLWQWLCERLTARLGGWGLHVVAPLAYLGALFVLGTTLIVLLNNMLPLGEMAMPLVVLHLILFGGMVKNWEEGLRKRLAGERRSPQPAGAEGDSVPPAPPSRQLARKARRPRAPPA